MVFLLWVAILISSNWLGCSKWVSNEKKSKWIRTEGRHQITYWNKIVRRLNTRFNEIGMKLGQNQDEIGMQSGQNWKRNKQNKKDAKTKKGDLNQFFIFIFIFFIIMAYLLTIGSRGRHKTLCRPKNMIGCLFWKILFFNVCMC